MTDSVNASLQPKRNPAGHPVGIMVAIFSALGFVISTGLFICGYIPLGDAIFYWITAALCEMSALGHVLCEDEPRPRRSKQNNKEDKKRSA